MLFQILLVHIKISFVIAGEIHIDDNGEEPQPGPSRQTTEEETMQQLMEMFPDKSRDDLVRALSLHGTVSAVALSLSSNLPEDDLAVMLTACYSLLSPLQKRK